MYLIKLHSVERGSFLALHHAPRPAAAPVLPLRAAAVLPRRLAGTPEGKRRQPCALAPCTGLCARSAPCATCADSKNCLQARLTSFTITADKRHILKTIYVPLAAWAGDSDIAYVHLGGTSLCYASYFSYEEGAGAQRFSLTMDASRITDELFLTSSELEVHDIQLEAWYHLMRTPNTMDEVEVLPDDAVVVVQVPDAQPAPHVLQVAISRVTPKPWSAAGVEARREASAIVRRAAVTAAERVERELRHVGGEDEDDVEDEEVVVEVEPAAICDIVERGTTKEEAALLIKQQKDAFSAGPRTRSQGNCYIMAQQAATSKLMNFENHHDAHLI